MIKDKVTLLLVFLWNNYLRWPLLSASAGNPESEPELSYCSEWRALPYIQHTCLRRTKQTSIYI